jgi:serine/threonine protein kinase
LASGAFSEVWLAEDEYLFHSPVALKMVRPRTAAKRRQGALETLRNAAELLVRIRHPNLVQVLGWVESEQDPALVLQYVPGGSLAHRLQREGRLEWPPAARYVADVAEGLLALHDRGIVHRDVKPANILWDPEIDEALLTDLGVGVRLAEPNDLGGTIPYMAPEAFDGQVSTALDVYGLAATLFDLVTGERPFPGPTITDLRHQARQGLPQPDPRCAGLPEPLERIVRAGLAAEPASRPSLDEFVKMLRGTLNQPLADALTMKSPAPRPDAATEPRPEPPPEAPQPPRLPAVTVRLVVSRRIGRNKFVPVAANGTSIEPPAPERGRLRTGDRVRIEVVADKPGYLTVFNIGPVGDLNLLYPDSDPQPASPPKPIEPYRTLCIYDVAMTPPAGRERLVAVWSRQPLPLHPDQLISLVVRSEGDSPTSRPYIATREREAGDPPASRPYIATRDMKRVQQSVQESRPEDWHAVVLELEHMPRPYIATATR